MEEDGIGRDMGTTGAAWRTIGLAFRIVQDDDDDDDNDNDGIAELISIVVEVASGGGAT